MNVIPLSDLPKRCSFCGKKHEEVTRLYGRPPFDTPAICNFCIDGALLDGLHYDAREKGAVV